MDEDYWQAYYKQKESIHSPSSFAQFCRDEFLTPGNGLVELGAGNGRDAVFFAASGLKVFAIDQVDSGLKRPENMAALSFVKGDFTRDKFEGYGDIRYIYSRFTMHVIEQHEEDQVIAHAAAALPAGGLLLIETRSIHDPLCGQGTHIKDNIWFTDHRRRFIDSEVLIRKCLGQGFRIRYFCERAGLSPLGKDDPVLIRLIVART
jgi:cyclopropane fatty-acyl-phospholipid synthase-like methyltransferase